MSSYSTMARAWLLLGVLAILCSFACPKDVEAQVADQGFRRTVAQLQAVDTDKLQENRFYFYVVTDPSGDADCTVGGGSSFDPHICFWDGEEWVALGATSEEAHYSSTQDGDAGKTHDGRIVRAQ